MIHEEYSEEKINKTISDTNNGTHKNKAETCIQFEITMFLNIFFFVTGLYFPVAPVLPKAIVKLPYCFDSHIDSIKYLIS